MATNNAINLKSSGIVSYDGVGAFTALANPLTVTNGGTGNSSLTAYCVLLGGTTSTNPVQSVTNTGISGQFLTSTGASSLPTWQNSTGFSMLIRSSSGNPADATTYFIETFTALTTSTTSGKADQKLYVPYACKLDSAIVHASVVGTLASAGNCTVSARVNNSADTTITSALAMTAADNTATGSSLGLLLNQGDYLEIKILTPTWATNPTTVAVTVNMFFL